MNQESQSRKKQDGQASRDEDFITAYERLKRSHERVLQIRAERDADGGLKRAIEILESSSARVRELADHGLADSFEHRANLTRNRTDGFWRDISALQGDQKEVSEDVAIAMIRIVAQEHPEVLIKLLKRILEADDFRVLDSRAFRILVRLTLDMGDRHESGPVVSETERKTRIEAIRALEARKREAQMRLHAAERARLAAEREYRIAQASYHEMASSAEAARRTLERLQARHRESLKKSERQVDSGQQDKK